MCYCNVSRSCQKFLCGIFGVVALICTLLAGVAMGVSYAAESACVENVDAENGVLVVSYCGQAHEYLWEVE